MTFPLLLLGDQIKKSAEICTQELGYLFGVFENSYEENKFQDLNFFELNLLVPTFLFCLKESGFNSCQTIEKRFYDFLLLHQTKKGSFLSSKNLFFNRQGNVFETSLVILNLLSLNKADKKSIYLATNWLQKRISLKASDKGVIDLDSLIGAYTVLKVANTFEDLKMYKSILEDLQVLSHASSFSHVKSSNKNLDQENYNCLAIRMIIELAYLSKKESLFHLAQNSLEKELLHYQELFNFMIEGQVPRFKNKRVNLGNCSLLAFSCFRLYQVYKLPDLLELASNLMRLISDIVIQADQAEQTQLPKSFNLKNGEFSKDSEISFIRYYLDAAELSKKFIADSETQEEENNERTLEDLTLVGA